MKKTLLLLFIVALTGILSNSCSDDSTNPSTDSKDLFPSKVGSHWIYDRNFKENGEDKSFRDSTAIAGSETVKGKLADKYISFNGNLQLEHFYRYSENSKLYALPGELLPADITALIPSEILPQEWVVIADDKASSWDMFSFKVDKVPLNLSGTTAELNGDIKVTGSKGGMVNLTVDGKTYSAQEFITKIAYIGKVTYSGLTPDLTFEVVTKSYFADKVGLIKSETPQQDVNISILGQNFKLYTIEANSRMLTHFKIAL